MPLIRTLLNGKAMSEVIVLSIRLLQLPKPKVCWVQPSSKSQWRNHEIPLNIASQYWQLAFSMLVYDLHC